MTNLSNTPSSKRLLLPALLLIATLLLLAGGFALGAQAQDTTTDDDTSVPFAPEFLAGLGIAMFAIPIIINILILVLIYKDAERRGKEGIGWLIFALLCGPLACLIWLLVRPPILPPGVPPGTQPGMPPPGFAPPPPPPPQAPPQDPPKY